MIGAHTPQVGLPNTYRYNGKEFTGEGGLGWNDYGARWYDPAIGRWGGVDPLAEDYSSVSTFVYANNNPVRYIDMDGKEWVNPYNKNSRRGKRVDEILEELRENDPELYDFIDKLSMTYSGKKRNIKVTVKLSGKAKGQNGQHAEVAYTPNTARKGEFEGIVTPIPRDMNDDLFGFSVTIHESGKKVSRNAISLSNEAGDIMYYMYNSEEVLKEKRQKKPYHDQTTTDYSFAVETVYRKRTRGELPKDKVLYPLIQKKLKLYTNDGKTKVGSF